MLPICVRVVELEWWVDLDHHTTWEQIRRRNKTWQRSAMQRELIQWCPMSSVVSDKSSFLVTEYKAALVCIGRPLPNFCKRSTGMLL
jgi:hypothetical protein